MAYGIVNVGGVGQGDISADVQAHNAAANAHPAILESLNEIKNRLLVVEAASGAEITANPFSATFGNLNGLKTTGIWNAAENRLEF